jgi:hypothetical protein
MAKRGPKPMTSMTDLLEKYGSFDKVPESAWRRMEANRDGLRTHQCAEREAARGDRSQERSILDEWEDNDHGLSEKDLAQRRVWRRRGTPVWPAMLATFKAAAQTHEGGEAHLREVFATYHRYGPRAPHEPVCFPLFRDVDFSDWFPVYDNRGCERGQGRLVGYEDGTPPEREAQRTIAYVLKWFTDWQAARQQPAARPAEHAAQKPGRPRKRPTKAEMRRRRGAEYTRRSRAKNPRPPKPRRTHADYLRAAEKSLATRIAKLAALSAALEATPVVPAGTSPASAEARDDLARQVAKCEEGIRRCRIDIEHYRNRAEAAARAAAQGKVERGNT